MAIEMPAKRKALGRGLDSLLPKAKPQEPAAAEMAREAGAQPVADGRPLEIPVAQIERNPYQTRTRFDEGALGELAASIEAVGVVQPVLVRALDGGRYQLVAGERRWLASQKAGKPTIPAVVAVMNNAQAMEATIVENLQRADLNPMEQARAFARLGREFRMTQEQISMRTGKDRASIGNYLRLLKLPEVLQASVEAGALSFGHARALLALENEERMLRAAQKIEALAMSVRQAETFIKGLLNPEQRENAAPKMESKDVNVREMERTLREALRLKVSIEDRGGRGRVVIEYADLEDFDYLVEQLTGSGIPGGL